MAGFAHIASPLTDLTKGTSGKGKYVIIPWLEEHEAAFKALKAAMMKEVVLEFPDCNKPYVLHTDASSFAIGGVLSQTDEVGNLRPVTFFSRRLNNAERNYDAVSREALAIIFGLKYNRPFIYGQPIELVCDNSPLIWLCSQADPPPRVARWQILLSEYNITNIKHIKGSQNLVADTLSRVEPDMVADLLEETPLLCNISLAEDSGEIDWNLAELWIKQDTVSLYDNIKKYLAGVTNIVAKGLTAPITQFFVENELLYLKNTSSYGLEKDRVCLPPSFVNKALRLAHSTPVSGHGGIHLTVERLRNFAY